MVKLPKDGGHAQSVVARKNALKAELLRIGEKLDFVIRTWEEQKERIEAQNAASAAEARAYEEELWRLAVRIATAPRRSISEYFIPSSAKAAALDSPPPILNAPLTLLRTTLQLLQMHPSSSSRMTIGANAPTRHPPNSISHPRTRSSRSTRRRL